MEVYSFTARFDDIESFTQWKESHPEHDWDAVTRKVWINEIDAEELDQLEHEYANFVSIQEV